MKILVVTDIAGQWNNASLKRWPRAADCRRESEQ